MPDAETLPKWELRPVSYDPRMIEEHDEDERPLTPFLHWSISFGCALNIGHLDGDPGSPLLVDVQFSDTDKARGFATRQPTPEQLVAFAKGIIDVVEAHVARQAEAAK